MADYDFRDFDLLVNIQHNAHNAYILRLHYKTVVTS